jgi:hypothetical protein
MYIFVDEGVLAALSPQDRSDDNETYAKVSTSQGVLVKVVILAGSFGT